MNILITWGRNETLALEGFHSCKKMRAATGQRTRWHVHHEARWQRNGLFPASRTKLIFLFRSFCLLAKHHEDDGATLGWNNCSFFKFPNFILSRTLRFNIYIENSLFFLRFNSLLSSAYSLLHLRSCLLCCACLFTIFIITLSFRLLATCHFTTCVLVDTIFLTSR